MSRKLNLYIVAGLDGFIAHLLGDGIRLFRDGSPDQSLVPEGSISYPSGLVQLRYDGLKK
jgi:hypothetical protein